MIDKQGLGAYIKLLPTNIFAGFVVSLVALPLGLGLALASGAPPIAGIISAVIGGIIVSIFGGSNVTITGPGNGLVVAVLASITVLGGGDMYQGYLYTLAAVVCSGAVMLVLAFANLGKLSNFFPSTAIQGLLAAIGLIILAKQFHIMVGNMDANGSTVELLVSIPKSVLAGIMNPKLLPAAIAGVVSLLIMIFYPKIRNKYFQLIPAPMWIVVIAVGLAYFFENRLGTGHPIAKEFFVSIPDKVFSNFPRPDFSKALSPDFLIAVFTLTMISSIESLLSIKAVDQLDPRKRRSDVGRDLKALGLATIVSGFFGGLNVVTVIARSSVNVNNKGVNRSSNFFHALFLVAFILLFKTQLEYIPFPALAAILVYTGYKLASPSIVQKVSEVGKEQVFIFFVTLLATIFTNLIIGIAIGIVITLITHVYMTKSLKLFINNFKTNNIETSHEEDGKLHVTVKHFSSFLNFFRLKKALDGIDPTKSVVVDFLQSQFIDDTVMESMGNYEQMFEKNGGHFEVIGLDLHKAESEHPSSLRRALEYVHFVPDSATLTKRQQLIGEFFRDLKWDFDHLNDYHMYFLADFEYFRTRKVDHLYNIGKDENNGVKFFDIEYSEGAFIAEEELHASMVYIETGLQVPTFTLSKIDFYERFHYLGTFKDIKLKTFRDFAQRFSLKGNSLLRIRRFFSDELILFFESNNYYHIESNGKGGLLIMDKERHSGVGEIKAMVDYANRLAAVIDQKKSR